MIRESLFFVLKVQKQLRCCDENGAAVDDNEDDEDLNDEDLDDEDLDQKRSRAAQDQIKSYFFFLVPSLEMCFSSCSYFSNFPLFYVLLPPA